MLKYIVFLLDDTNVSFCHYEVPKRESCLMPLNVLRDGILFAMKKNLSVQIVYPRYELPKEYLEIINEIDHSNIMPNSYESNDADAIVADNWNMTINNSLSVPLIIRTSRSDLFDNYKKLDKWLKYVQRIDVVITDIDAFKEEDFIRYKELLEELTKDIEQMYVERKSPQLNILTDRMMLKEMRNCGAGNTTITLAPNGKFYICPAFYHEDEADNIGDLSDGLEIRNKQLYKLDHAPICRYCDAWQCKRCVWLNRETTLEVNTPSHEQCVVAHIERNASRTLLNRVRMHGAFLPEFEEIKEIDYLDPFDKRKEWK